MSSPPPHDDDRCARLYRDCKRSSVAYARRLLASSGGRNRHLAAFDAEEFYDAAWVTYYERREYLDPDRDHVACLNALILSRFRDERRRSRAQKRTAPGEAVDFDPEEAGAAPDAAGAAVGDRVADRDELRRLLARVDNPADARALFDHEVRGLSFAEIGRREGVTAEAARRRAQRASRQARGQEEDDHE
ncbi:MAG TPA: sigma-70 family RNA polymerase sigma factor [Acidimicrobiales bacterium]